MCFPLLHLPRIRTGPDSPRPSWKLRIQLPNRFFVTSSLQLETFSRRQACHQNRYVVYVLKEPYFPNAGDDKEEKPMRLFQRSLAAQVGSNLPRATRRARNCAPGASGAFLFALLMMTAASCGNSSLQSAQRPDSSPSGFRIESAAFKQGAFIPSRFSCSGENLSPPLKWMDPPPGARSFALIVDDPDAPGGVWTHWVVFNLPAQTRALDENAPKQDKLSNGALQGLNSFESVGYGGPCPPPGKAHRYFFRLYALDTVLTLQPRAPREDVAPALKGHTLGETELMGLFKR
ncbi:MAG TPA: YbhB/YbcL family Raf kinase inhibitor-like protein [Terriglobia bacterium]|nr:YbhB/YbcL family Raf kinase inhibitor-like protein [Terriglobia bacterium]